MPIDGDQPRRVLGIPPDAPERIESASVAWEPAEVPAPPPEGLYGPVSRPKQKQVGADSVAVAPQQTESRLFASEWYVGSADLVTSLGEPRAIVIDTGTATDSGQVAGWRVDDAPLIAALPFLLQGVSQIVRTLSLAVLGSGVLVLIVVYNVTRMSIRDCRQEIRVARSIGISPYRLFALLKARVAAVTGTGVALGFAVGLISTNTVINAATYAGLPVTIRTVVTPEILRLCLQIGGFLFGMGLAAGVLAVVPAILSDPAEVAARNDTRESNGHFRMWFRGYRKRRSSAGER